MTSWREGQELCEWEGGYLAEIKTEEQQIFLVGPGREVLFYKNFSGKSGYV